MLNKTLHSPIWRLQPTSGYVCLACRHKAAARRRWNSQLATTTPTETSDSWFDTLNDISDNYGEKSKSREKEKGRGTEQELALKDREKGFTLRRVAAQNVNLSVREKASYIHATKKGSVGHQKTPGFVRPGQSFGSLRGTLQGRLGKKKAKKKAKREEGSLGVETLKKPIPDELVRRWMMGTTKMLADAVSMRDRRIARKKLSNAYHLLKQASERAASEESRARAGEELEKIVQARERYQGEMQPERKRDRVEEVREEENVSGGYIPKNPAPNNAVRRRLQQAHGRLVQAVSMRDRRIAMKKLRNAHHDLKQVSKLGTSKQVIARAREGPKRVVEVMESSRDKVESPDGIPQATAQVGTGERSQNAVETVDRAATEAENSDSPGERGIHVSDEAFRQIVEEVEQGLEATKSMQNRERAKQKLLDVLASLRGVIRTGPSKDFKARVGYEMNRVNTGLHEIRQYNRLHAPGQPGPSSTTPKARCTSQETTSEEDESTVGAGELSDQDMGAELEVRKAKTNYDTKKRAFQRAMSKESNDEVIARRREQVSNAKKKLVEAQQRLADSVSESRPQNCVQVPNSPSLNSLIKQLAGESGAKVIDQTADLRTQQAKESSHGATSSEAQMNSVEDEVEGPDNRDGPNQIDGASGQANNESDGDKVLGPSSSKEIFSRKGSRVQKQPTDVLPSSKTLHLDSLDERSFRSVGSSAESRSANSPTNEEVPSRIQTKRIQASMPMESLSPRRPSSLVGRWARHLMNPLGLLKSNSAELDTANTTRNADEVSFPGTGITLASPTAVGAQAAQNSAIPLGDLQSAAKHKKTASETDSANKRSSVSSIAHGLPLTEAGQQNEGTARSRLANLHSKRHELLSEDASLWSPTEASPKDQATPALPTEPQAPAVPAQPASKEKSAETPESKHESKIQIDNNAASEGEDAPKMSRRQRMRIRKSQSTSSTLGSHAGTELQFRKFNARKKDGSEEAKIASKDTTSPSEAAENASEKSEVAEDSIAGLSIADAMKPLNSSVKRTRTSAARPLMAQSDIKLLGPAGLEVSPLDVPQPPVPYLQYGLDRVLFNPGVYQLQEPTSRVYNFDPYLQKIMPVVEFDFNSLKEYKTSSQDTLLSNLALKHGKRYIGSTSSMTGSLGHFHYLLSNWRELNLNMLSHGYVGKDTSRSFTEINRAPSAIFLRWKNGTYAIDADKEYDSANVLMLLGKSMELLLTLPKDEYERYRKSNPRQVPEEQKTAPESYQFSTMGDFLMRSQLDAHDPRLGGNGTFDLKTRAVVAVRMDSRDFEPMTGYEIASLHGRWNSYEREFADMMRSTMLKYMLQARMGRMNGIFIAYHNVKRIFGFQYIPMHEMDRALHGQTDPCLGDQEFKASLEMMNEVLNRATAKFPKQSLRIHFETRPGNTSTPAALHIFAEPKAEEEIERIQNSQKEKIAAFERQMMGKSESDEVVDPGSGNEVDVDASTELHVEEGSVDSPEKEEMDATEYAREMIRLRSTASRKEEAQEVLGNIVDEAEAGSDDPEAEATCAAAAAPPLEANGTLKPLFHATVIVQNKIDGHICASGRPEGLRPGEMWEIEYILKDYETSPAQWALYEETLARRKRIVFRKAEEDEAESEVQRAATNATYGKKDDHFKKFLRGMAERGSENRRKADEEDMKRAIVRVDEGLPAVREKVEGVEDYVGWLYEEHKGKQGRTQEQFG